jgi:hypothetical protein
MTYIDISKKKDGLLLSIEDSRNLAYKHTIKADNINEQLIINPEIYFLNYNNN